MDRFIDCMVGFCICYMILWAGLLLDSGIKTVLKKLDEITRLLTMQKEDKP